MYRYSRYMNCRFEVVVVRKNYQLLPRVYHLFVCLDIRGVSPVQVVHELCATTKSARKKKQHHKKNTTSYSIEH